MKRLLLIFASALALSGCITFGDLADPIVRVAETVSDDSTSAKGITTGMSSSDARDVLINREYYGAIKKVHGGEKSATGPQLLLDIEPIDGEPIVIHAKRFKVYAPPSHGSNSPSLAIAPPIEKKSTWVAVSQEARGWLRDAVLPWKSIEEGGQTDRLRIQSSDRQYQIQVEAFESIAGQGIEAASKPPLVVTAPAPVAAPVE